MKVEAAKGVILAGGGFGGNADMLTDLYTESLGLKPEGETLSAGMDQDGSGVALGYWAGGKLDPCMSGMGGNYFYPCDSPSDPAGTAPVLWLNSKGKRYCNEGFGSIELAAIPGAKEPSGIVATVFGSNVDDYVYAQVPSHMAIDYSHEASQPSMSGLHETMEKALAGGAKGSAEDEASSEDAGAGEGGAPAGGPGGPGGPGGGVTMYCSDDLATLAGYLGYTGEAADNFVASVERYNELCDQGRDEDFGKDPHLMIRMEPPYYAYCAEKGDRHAYGHDVRLAGEPRQPGARSELRSDPRPVLCRQQLRQPLRIPVHDVHFGREPGLRADSGIPGGEVRGRTVTAGVCSMPPLCEGRAWFAKGLATDASGQTMDAGAGCGQNRFHSVDSAAYGASPPRDLASNACSAEREFRYLCQKTKN